MYCQNCAIEVMDEAAICPSCGRKVSKWPNEDPLAKPTRNTVRPTERERASQVSKTILHTDRRFPTGTLLADRYRIVDLLGRGGMGEVYRADDLKLGQQVALKLLPEAMEEEQKALSLFLNEVRLARKISHPNVCRVHDVVEAEGLHFLTMESIDGEDMSTSLRRIGHPSKTRALELAQQICVGLEAAHQQGILHRDLKPANLMIDGEGKARITDFGVAVLADQISGSGIHLGTPFYMAPEQLAGDGVSVRSDLYSLGLVLYELFTGQRAFKAMDLKELRLQRGAPPRAPSELVEELGPAVDRAILQCLEPEPEDRPASALRVAAILQGSDPHLDHAVLKTVVGCRFTPEESLGDVQAVAAEDFFPEEVHGLVREHGGEEIESPEETLGTLLLFDRPVSAVRFVVALHQELSLRGKQGIGQVAAQVGIHLGEVVPWEGSVLSDQVEPRWTVTREAMNVVSALTSLAGEGQNLLSRAVFDLARQSPVTGFEEVRWLAHGSYEITGLVESLEIFEVGSRGVAPLSAPPETEVARRRLVQETIIGWRPAPGLELPQRPHWRLEGKLEEGGFGEVWLASHEKTRQRRVFKFCYEPASLRSLQREITLFRLLKEELGDRTDINRILDWNFAEAPYFIEAEYTEGGNLLDWAEDQGGLEKVPLEVRLEVLAQVATALAAAHSVGVLHKDVKPGNILMWKDTEGGVRAQLSDFGVGKITEQGRLEQAGITVLGMTEEIDSVSAQVFSGTRLYMAPELMEGRSATMQADIYALGVMLYQAVVSDFSAALAPGWERDVKDELLREDISAAVDGALERRLSSASLLAYRLRSLGKRRKALAAEQLERERVEEAMNALELGRRRRKFVALAMVVLVAFAGAMAFMWRKVDLERERVAQQAEKAAEEAEVAHQVSDFMLNLFESPAPEEALGETPTARELLDRGAEKIEVGLHEQPKVQARLIHTMGEAYRRLGHYDKGEELARKALAIWESSSDVDSRHLVEGLELLGSSLLYTGKLEESEKIFQRALELREAEHGIDSLAAARVMNSLGYLLISKDDHLAAEPYFEKALGIQRSFLDGGSIEVADTLGNLGIVRFYSYRFSDAEALLEESLLKKREIFGAMHPKLNKELLFLAQAKRMVGEFDEAETLVRESMAINLKIRGVEHPLYAGGLNFLGDIYKEKGDFQGAENYYLEALEHHRENLGAQHYVVGQALTRLALFYYSFGHNERSRDSIQEALDILGSVRPESISFAMALRCLAVLLEVEGDYEKSHETFTESLALVRVHLRDQDVRVATAMVHVARGLVRQGQCELAIAMTNEALQNLQYSQLSEDRWEIAQAKINLGICRVLSSQFTEAEATLLEVYSSFQQKRGGSVPYVRDVLQQLVMLYEAWGKDEKANQFRRELALADNALDITATSS